jgi:hypothetical protein
VIYDDDFDDPQEALAHYRELLKARQAYKRALQLQSAQYGLAAPPHVVTELEKVRAEIPQLRQKIKQLEGGAAPLSAPSTPIALPAYTHDDPALSGKLPMEFPAYDWEHASQEEAERAVLQTIHNIEQQSPSTYVDDLQIAETLEMDLQDVRDYMDILEEEGLAKAANSHDGHSAILTARGRLRLRGTAGI